MHSRNGLTHTLNGMNLNIIWILQSDIFFPPQHLWIGWMWMCSDGGSSFFFFRYLIVDRDVFEKWKYKVTRRWCITILKTNAMHWNHNFISKKNHSDTILFIFFIARTSLLFAVGESAITKNGYAFGSITEEFGKRTKSISRF